MLHVASIQVQIEFARSQFSNERFYYIDIGVPLGSRKATGIQLVDHLQLHSPGAIGAQRVKFEVVRCLVEFRNRLLIVAPIPKRIRAQIDGI